MDKNEIEYKTRKEARPCLKILTHEKITIVFDKKSHIIIGINCFFIGKSLVKIKKAITHIIMEIIKIYNSCEKPKYLISLSIPANTGSLNQVDELIYDPIYDCVSVPIV